MKNRNQTFKYILSILLALAAVFCVSRHEAVARAAGADRIYYFNMDDKGLEGSMMLVESNGHWGLVDAGHTNATTIKDASGRTYSTAVNGLSSQVYCRNGADVANYMINTLGVRHLDFIVGTHAHSDHVGGIPGVAAATYRDASGRTMHLVDSTTTYYYKEYKHISDLEDDLVRYSSDSWHNQAFAYQAKVAMANQGAQLIDVSTSPQVVQGDPGNAYGDYVTFNVGNMSFRLYNVHEQTNTGNENVNSIVTVMTNGSYTVVNLADINTNNGAIDKTSKAIAKDYGSVDVVVAGHHGYAGSNTKSMFDSLQPSFVVVPNGHGDSWLYTDCDLAAAMPYAQGLFGTKFYNLSISQYAVVTDLSGRQVYVYTVSGSGDLTNALNKVIKQTNKTGWVSWIQTNGTIWSYLQKGNPVRNDWVQDEGRWYFFDGNGLMYEGWLNRGGQKYYLYYNNGFAARGWEKLGGKWYYFDPVSCAAQTGMRNIDGKLFSFDSNGVMQEGWIKQGGKSYYFYYNAGFAARGMETLAGKKYYFDPNNCTMQTGWVLYNGGWYYFNGDGVMQMGWLNEGGHRYYLYQGVGLAARGWENLGGKWYHFDEQKCWLDTRSGWQQINGGWYYFDRNGNMQTGWLNEGGHRYYLYQGVGLAARGWETLSGNKYYFDPVNCDMKTGWQQIDGGWYYFNGSGVLQAGWLNEGGHKYYLYQSNGLAARGWDNLGGKWYHFDEQKCWLDTPSGWQQINGGWYYFDRNGNMQTGWLNEGGHKYYLYLSNGLAARGWETLGGNKYYFDLTSCAMKAGWAQIDGGWYYFDGNGVLQTGWLDEGGHKYYLYQSNGLAARGWEKLGDRWYHFDEQKCWLDTPSGWQEINGGWYYLDSSGKPREGWFNEGGNTYYLYQGVGLAARGWETLSGNKYYFDTVSCAMVTGWQQIDGNWYYFYPEDGSMARSTTVDGYEINADGIWLS